MSNTMIIVLGARGSIPVSGSEYSRYGGSTTCFALIVADTVVAFIDGGTGLVSALGRRLRLAPSLDVFLTHYHWDHIQGLSMMDEMWAGACDIRVWGRGDPSSTLGHAISPPLFPVSIENRPNIRFEEADGPVERSGVLITPFGVHHPQGACGYRIDGPDRSVVIATDHEAGTDVDTDVTKATLGADVLIHDAQYLPDELAAHEGWGHSSYEQAIVAAERAGVSELILTSHGPHRSDSAIDDMVLAAKDTFANTGAAYPGMEIPL